MKHTLKKLYTYFSIILLTAFCTFSFAQDAFSAPKWIKVTYSKPTLQVIGKDKNNSGYLLCIYPSRLPTPLPPKLSVFWKNLS